MVKKQKKSPEASALADIALSPITDTLKDNFMPYAMSVIVSRAIPEIDGFKPSHRKLLYTMYRMGLSKGHRAKSADIVGQTMALNPHGDQAIYETMVRMTKGNGALLNPWIDSKGNFGRIYSRDMQYAAYRYTEARLDESATVVLDGLEKDAVDFVDNYSGTLKEPVLLPAAVPTILINANQGIAVGMASNIASFNFQEVCEACKLLLKDPEADVMQVMPAPDFSTGAKIIYDPEQMRRIYQEGRGSFRMRATVDVRAKEQRILIKEIPYNTTVEAIIDDVAKQAKAGRLKEVTDVRDETDLHGLSISVEYRRGSDVSLLLQKLYRLTEMEKSFSCNFNLLIDNRPLRLGVRGILLEWIAWRRRCLTRTLQWDRHHLAHKLSLLEALETLLLDIDKAIRIIRGTKLEKDVVQNLMQAFAINETQAEYVAEIKLRHLNREYLLRRIEEMAQLSEEIQAIDASLNSQKRLDALIAKQLTDHSKRFARERKTALLDTEAVKPLEEEDMIEDYNLRVFFTAEGYLKKLPLTSLRSAGELKLKDEDRIIQSIEGSNKSEILFFSDKAQVYKLKAYEISDHKPSEFGDYTPNLLELEDGERILYIHVTDDDFKGVFMLLFADGRGVKIAVDHYQTKTRRKVLKNAFYGGAELKALFYLEDEKEAGDFLATNSQERMILCDLALVPFKKTRHSRGAQIMSLRKGYVLEQAKRVQADEAEEQAYYRVRSLPAAGRFLKEETKQLSFIEETQ